MGGERESGSENEYYPFYGFGDVKRELEGRNEGVVVA